MAKKNYRGLTRTVDAWSLENAQTFIYSRNRLTNWGQSNPQALPPHDFDQARRLLQSEPLLRDFAKSKPKSSWYEPLLEAGYLTRILQGKGESKEFDYPLADLVLDWIFEDPDLWITTLWQYRFTVHSILLEGFCRRITQDTKRTIPVETIQKCFQFFQHLIECGRHAPLSIIGASLLRRLVEDVRISEAVWLFQVMVRPEIEYRRVPSSEYVWRQMEGKDATGIPEFATATEERFLDLHAEHHAHDLLRKILLPKVEMIGFPLVQTLSFDLARLEETLRNTDRGPDSSVIDRSAIEPHKADKHKEGPLHFLIDALRETVDQLANASPGSVAAVRDLWLQSNSSLLERLAIHATRTLMERK